MHLTVSFLWYDFWIGFYYDRENKVLYICPIPCVVFKFRRIYYQVRHNVASGDLVYSNGNLTDFYRSVVSALSKLGKIFKCCTTGNKSKG